jgi:hypothetical protein
MIACGTNRDVFIAPPPLTTPCPFKLEDHNVNAPALAQSNAVVVNIFDKLVKPGFCRKLFKPQCEVQLLQLGSLAGLRSIHLLVSLRHASAHR